MTPYTIVCNGCASQISKRSKVYSNVTTCGKYLGVSIHEVRIRCPHCASFILFKVNPTKHDYDLVSGAVQLLQEQENPADDEAADGGAADFTGSGGGGAAAVDSIESVQQALLNAERIDALTSAAGVKASDLGRARAAVEAGAAATEAEASASAAAAAAASARNVEWTAKDSEQARADFDAAKARAAAANGATAAPTSISSLLPPVVSTFAFSSAAGTFGVFAGDSGAGAAAGVSDLMSSMRAAIQHGNASGSSSSVKSGTAPTSALGSGAAVVVGRQLDSVLASLLRNPAASTTLAATTALAAPSPSTGGSTSVADASTSGVSGKTPIVVSNVAVVVPSPAPPAGSEETAPVAVNGGRRARRGGNLLSELTE
jgi:DNA-directed RNA polymerase subunit RPC12/RpoP